MQIQFTINPSRPVSDLSIEEQYIVDNFHRLYYRSMVWDGPTTWMGWPIAKNPLDLWVYQELLHEIRPQIIIETGTYFGGSTLYLASLCDMLGAGEVYTVDIASMPRPLHPRIHFLSGSSTDPAIVAEIRAAATDKRTLVILDSDHRQEHVLAELHAYAPLVTQGSYLVVEDTNVNGHPVEEHFGPGPAEAVTQFLQTHADFEHDRLREKFFMTFNTYLKRGSAWSGSPFITTDAQPRFLGDGR